MCLSKYVLIDFYCCILYFSQLYTFYLFWTSRPSSCSSNHIKKSTIECYSIRFAIMSRLLLTMKINRILCIFIDSDTWFYFPANIQVFWIHKCSVLKAFFFCWYITTKHVSNMKLHTNSLWIIRIVTYVRLTKVSTRKQHV